ncbi:MAG: HAD-IG family 5'-nucleotidase [Spirochaetales bacterium]|nr:HAD-IG family 5'-nucleotidase [Spirochaetales bacterium]
MLPAAEIAPERRIWSNRTLNLRAIRAIGYDMDYTLVHYRTEEWERAAFQQALAVLVNRGWPVESLSFEPTSVIQGLAFDLDLGNLVKATRFGYVIRAHHGTRALSFEEQRAAYAGSFVELSEPRWTFMNTLFSLSEASLFAQLVSLADAGGLPETVGYRELYRILRSALDEAHNLGELKAKIAADPDRFVELDPEVPLTLLDQQAAGKRLLLVTNSDWGYTRSMMSYAFDRFLPQGRSWRDLFELVVLEARKPAFFSGRQAVYRVVDEGQGLLRPHRGPLEAGGVYVGGAASLVEESLALSGAQILYVGDHLFGDVHVSKEMLRWRTALILREIEPEVRALEESRGAEAELRELMARKTELDNRLARLRLARQREQQGYAPGAGGGLDALQEAIKNTGQEIVSLDATIAPLAKAFGEMGNPTWGPLMRAGSDKSLFARQVERYADVYTSRVSNFLGETPFAYLRAARVCLPHDPS